MVNASQAVTESTVAKPKLGSWPNRPMPIESACSSQATRRLARVVLIDRGAGTRAGTE